MIYIEFQRLVLIIPCKYCTWTKIPRQGIKWPETSPCARENTKTVVQNFMQRNHIKIPEVKGIFVSKVTVIAQSLAVDWYIEQKMI